MQPVNRYYKSAKISEAKFRYLLRLFALDLTASDTARLTGLSIRSVNTIYLRLRRRLQANAMCQSTWRAPSSWTNVTSVRDGCGGSRAGEQGAKRWSSACSNGAVRCIPK